MQPLMQQWVCLSSSSGETFKALYNQLQKPHQEALRGFFTDRPCLAGGVAKQLLGGDKVFEYSKSEFEKQTLQNLKSMGFDKSGKQLTVFLCGFFGILSEAFLNECPGPVVNTHPSLLPAFPGLDQRVHRMAAENVSVSGFTLHLVTTELDGGPILFQHPVWLKSNAGWEDNRQRVRAAEQKWLPIIFPRLLDAGLKAEDRNRKSFDLRRQYKLDFESFQDVEFLQ